MAVLLLVPTVFSLLVLAAHFLRAGVLPAVVFLIVIIPLLGLRRGWVPRLFQAVLGLGALEWLRTLATLRAARMAMGLPHARMVAILAGVALFTLGAAALFEVRPLRDWYRARDPE